jgi:hypothetical protein
MTSPRPLACPFCGGRADALSSDGWWHVRCRDCRATSRPEDADEAAVAAWNARVNDQGVLR